MTNTPQTTSSSRDFEELECAVATSIEESKGAHINSENAILRLSWLFFQISSKGLFKTKASSMTAYGRKWGMKKERTSRLVSVGSVYHDLRESWNKGVRQATSESQLRPLVRLTSGQERTEAWIKAVAAADGQVPTAKQVSRAVSHHIAGTGLTASIAPKISRPILRLDFTAHPELWRYLHEESAVSGRSVTAQILDLLITATSPHLPSMPPVEESGCDPGAAAIPAELVLLMLM